MQCGRGIPFRCLAAASTAVMFHTSFGAGPTPNGVTFSVWAPKARRIHVVLFSASNPDKETSRHSLAKTENGAWRGTIAEATVGSLYKYLVETEEGVQGVGNLFSSYFSCAVFFFFCIAFLRQFYFSNIFVFFSALWHRFISFLSPSRSALNQITLALNLHDTFFARVTSKALSGSCIKVPA